MQTPDDNTSLNNCSNEISCEEYDKIFNKVAGNASENGNMSGNGANVSFAGCGFLGIYHVGAATCFKQYAPQLLSGKIAGASAGALVACTLICDCCMGECTTFTLKLALEARARVLGPLSPRFRLVKSLREALGEFLPDNAHEICSGRLHISLTRLSDRQNVLISQFSSKDNLIDALICSSFVPLYSGIWPPCYNSVRYIDGAVSDNLPILDDQTITVSPFAGESDICPDDNSCNIHHIHLGGTSIQFTAGNLYRMSVAFFPPAPEELSRMCRQGFDDALRYLHKSKLITCSQHLSVKSHVITLSAVKSRMIDRYNSSNKPNSADQGSLRRAIRRRLRLAGSESLSDSSDESGEESDDEMEDSDNDADQSSSCDECQERNKTSMGDVPPLKVERALQAACDVENQALLAPLYKHTAYKVASLMAVPYLFPIEVAYNLVRKMYEWSPYMSEDMQWFFKELYRLLTELLQSIQDNKHLNIWELFNLTWYLGFNMFPGNKKNQRARKKSSSSLHSVTSASSLGSIHSPMCPTPSIGQRSRRSSLKSAHRHHKTSVVTYEGPVDLDCVVTEGADQVESIEVDFGINANYCLTESPVRYVSNVRKQLLEEGRAAALASSRASSTWSLASVDTVASGTGEANQSSEANGSQSAVTFTTGTCEHGADDVTMNVGECLEARTASPASIVAIDSSFDEVLYVSNQMDSILSYYYAEESDPSKFRVVELFPLHQRHHHRRHASGGSQGASSHSSPARTRKKSRKISHVLIHD